MGEVTGISWTDHTWNPWWGCERIANPDGSGCDHCYAADLAKRYGHDVWGKGNGRRSLSDAHWRLPLKWDRDAEAAGAPALVFCASMGDVFEDRRDLDDSRARLFGLIDATPHLVWQLLTKRPERIPSLVPRSWMRGSWPANAWAGTTVEHQPAARLRLPRLVRIPAPVLFLSVEPMLGPVRLDLVARLLPELGWVICGGESGPGRRPFDHAWARDLRDQCGREGVPFFFKQDAGPHSGAPGPPDLDGLKQYPAAAGRPA